MEKMVISFQKLSEKNSEAGSGRSMTSRCFLLLEQHTLPAVCPFQKEAIIK